VEWLTRWQCYRTFRASTYWISPPSLSNAPVKVWNFKRWDCRGSSNNLKRFPVKFAMQSPQVQSLSNLWEQANWSSPPPKKGKKKHLWVAFETLIIWPQAYRSKPPRAFLGVVPFCIYKISIFKHCFILFGFENTLRSIRLVSFPNLQISSKLLLLHKCSVTIQPVKICLLLWGRKRGP